MAKSRKKSLDLVLDMGTYEMRLMRLESASPGEMRLKKCYSVSSPREFVVSTFIEFPIMEPESVFGAVNSLVREAKLSYENTMCLFPDHAAIVNLMVTPPRYSMKETDEAVRDDFTPIMPLPIENWHIVHQTAGVWEEDEILVAVAILKNNLVEAGGIIQNAGLNPQMFDLNFFNVVNLIEHYLTSEQTRGKNVCMVHLGHETTSIGVFRDGQIRSFQNRPVGGWDFTKQIIKHFHVPDAEAESFKQNEVFFLPEPSPEQDGLYNYTVIKSVFTVLVREIFSAIESYLTRFHEFSVHEIIISGGGANFKNIEVLLSSNLNTTVRPVADLFNLYIGNDSVDEAGRNALAAGCGAFLRE